MGQVYGCVGAVDDEEDDELEACAVGAEEAACGAVAATLGGGR